MSIDCQYPLTSNKLIPFSASVTGSKIQLGGWAAYSVLLWALKASLLFLYARLTVSFDTPRL